MRRRCAADSARGHCVTRQWRNAVSNWQGGLALGEIVERQILIGREDTGNLIAADYRMFL
jgi:hypothetical protein